MKDKFRKNKKTKENAFKVLTGKSGYGRLDVALSKKQSRVSTLTIAQVSDYWSDIDNAAGFLYRSCYY